MTEFIDRPATGRHGAKTWEVFDAAILATLDNGRAASISVTDGKWTTARNGIISRWRSGKFGNPDEIAIHFRKLPDCLAVWLAKR